MISKRLALSVLFLAAACSSPGGGGPSGGPVDGTGPATVTAYCDEYWAAYAARWVACERGSAADAAAVYGKLTDGETCYSHESCASGVCLSWPNACPSTCRTPTPSGSPCEFGI